MNARQDGRQGHWYDPTALAEPENFPEPKPTSVKNSTGATVSNAVVSRTPVHFPVRTSNAAAWALFTLVVGTGLIVACVLLTLGAPS